MLKEARRLYDAGWAIHLLRPKSKIPIHKNWSAGPRHSWSQIQDAYKKGMNIGVRLGKASEVGGEYLAVIDIDVKSPSNETAKEIIEKLDELSLPLKTLTVISGRRGGSRHLYFTTREPAQPRRLAQSSKKAPVLMPSVAPSRTDKSSLSPEQIEAGYRLRPTWEISLMGEGQQVVLPPSIHPDTGKSYKWGNHGKHIRTLHIEGIVKNHEEKIEKTSLTDASFHPVPVDLWTSGLPDESIHQIVDGEGVDDRSRALFGASVAMWKCGLSEIQILSVLTDTDNFLGTVAYEHAGTKSRSKAAQWLLNYTLKKAAREADPRNDFDVVAGGDGDEDDLGIGDLSEPLVDTADWRCDLERTGKGENSKPAANFKNVKMILENVVRPGFIKHNEFNLEDTWLEDTPWRGRKGESIRPIDVLNIKDYLIENFRIEVGKDKIVEVLQVIGDKNSFHPVRDYLNSVKWDGKPRLNTWLKDYLGATGNPLYLKTVGRKTLIAMVARVFNPGCAFHHVLILEGKTRHGKSETWKILAGKDWHFDNELDLRNKDSRQALLGKWVVELAELASLHQSGVNSMKNFISNDVDNFRKPYAPLFEKFKRQCIFVGTTNNERYLKDLTGNARYWPVKIDRLRYDELHRDRDQLFAEAKLNFDLEEHINHHSQEFYKLAEVEQGKREEGGDVESLILEILQRDEPLETGRKFSKGFRVVDLLKALGPVPGYRNERALEMKTAIVLRENGYQKTQCRVGGIRGYWWLKR